MPQCNQCGYDSNDDGAELPEYKFCNGNQITHCPDCMNIIDSREQGGEKLAGRF